MRKDNNMSKNRNATKYSGTIKISKIKKRKILFCLTTDAGLTKSFVLKGKCRELFQYEYQNRRYQTGYVYETRRLTIYTKSNKIGNPRIDKKGREIVKRFHFDHPLKWPPPPN